MKYLFFINPTAGKGDLQAPVIKSIKEYFKENGGDYIIHSTQFPGDAEKTAREYAQSGEEIRMFACGGEGTVFEVINGVVGYNNVSVGVIPCGSANDFLKFFKTKKEFFDISSQVSGRSVSMDIIKAGERYCLNGCSVGMDAMVARDMSIFKNWPYVSGKLAYKLAIAKNFLSKLGVSIKLSVDGGVPKPVRCLFAVIANAPYYGGGYMSAPEAVPNDGKLDFTLVNVISRLRVPKFLSSYEKGEHKKFDFCEMKSCESMEFTSDKPVPINLDGELVVSKSMKFEIVRKALNFIVPNTVSVKMLTNV